VIAPSRGITTTLQPAKRSICAVAISISDPPLVCAAFSSNSAAKSQCGRAWRHRLIRSTKRAAAFEHLKNRIPPKNAVVVDKLKAACAIIIGKTNMRTLGMGTTGLESSFGAVKNPWNPEYIPGGSSSGSAAAVASGLCYATLDTDAIDSCRLRAACCGVVGFKGTYGFIESSGGRFC
jgi:hypothetical protein